MIKIRRSQRFKDAFNKLDLQIRKKVERALRLFMQNPRHPFLHTKKIQGRKDIWEVGVDIHYRFTFDVTDEGVHRLRNVDNHDECLKNP